MDFSRYSMLAVAAALAGAALITPTETDACSPPPPVMFQDWGTEEDPLYATGDSLGVRVDIYDEYQSVSLDEAAVTVTPTGTPDEPVEGKWSFEKIHPEQGGQNRILIWTADEALPAGTYKLQLETDYGFQNETYFEKTDASESLEDFEFGLDSLQMNEVRSRENNCCKRADCDPNQIPMCGESSEDFCQTCWSVRYEYRPQVEAATSFEPGSFIMHVYRGVQAADNHIRSFPMTSTRETSVAAMFREGAEGPYCIRVEVERMEDGKVVADSGSVCATEDEMEPFERRLIDNTSIMDQCEAPPEETSDDPSWQRYEEQHGGFPAPTCSTGVLGSPSGSTPISLVSLLLGGLAIGFVRRRRDRSA